MENDTTQTLSVAREPTIVMLVGNENDVEVKVMRLSEHEVGCLNPFEDTPLEKPTSEMRPSDPDHPPLYIMQFDKLGMMAQVRRNGK